MINTLNHNKSFVSIRKNPQLSDLSLFQGCALF
jgi:hypothetical protein